MPYKIRNAENLYSTGGDTPRFTRDGKTWSTLGRLKAHLKFVSNIGNDWVIEEHGYIKDVFKAKDMYWREP